MPRPADRSGTPGGPATGPGATGPAAAGQDGLAEPMRSRWSPSVFQDGPGGDVDDDELAALLTAAAWAPSSGNTQPWAFLVLRRGTAGHGALVDTLRRGNLAWVPRAPVVVVAAHRFSRAPGEERDPPVHAAYDLGQAAAHLTLQAVASGLVVHQFAGFDRDRFAGLAGVPEWFRVLTGIAVGRHGDPASVDPGVSAWEERERARRPLSESVHGERWGVPWAPAG